MTDSWVGFDLDGTLAKYDGWKGIDHIGEPIEPIVSLLKEHIEEGIIVKIFTARCSEKDSAEAIKYIQDWCEKHIGHRLEVTNVKDYGMEYLYDDRAVQVISNKGIILENEFRTQNKLTNELAQITSRKRRYKV